MSTGCTNPSAANYDSTATEDDGSCVYMVKDPVDGNCYAFQDVAAADVEDKSFTLSFSIDGKDWVFFHDYVPDFYFGDREHLYALKDKKIYRVNQGDPGKYFSSATSSFFIDMIFASDQEYIMNSLQWITEVLSSDKDQEFSTLTHITIWNSQQCTGRIALSQVWEDLSYEVRKTAGLWSFDTFRDMVKTSGTTFLTDIFSNFAVDTTALDQDKPWFDQDLLHDDWFCVRLEFDNTNRNTCFIHGADINASKSYR